VAAAGHKWVLGPWGAGFLYVDREAATELAPRAVGYRSVEDPNADEIVFKEGAKRFEVGSTTPAAHVGLIEALDAIDAVGIATIEDRIASLTDRLKDGVPDDRLLSPREYESGSSRSTSTTPRRRRSTGSPTRGSSFVLSRTRTGSGRRSTPSPPRPRSTGSSSGSPSSGERSIGRVLVLRVQD